MLKRFVEWLRSWVPEGTTIQEELQDRRGLEADHVALVVERDNLRKMLEDANAREEIQLRALMALREEISKKQDPTSTEYNPQHRGAPSSSLGPRT